MVFSVSSSTRIFISCPLAKRFYPWTSRRDSPFLNPILLGIRQSFGASKHSSPLILILLYHIRRANRSFGMDNTGVEMCRPRYPGLQFAGEDHQPCYSLKFATMISIIYSGRKYSMGCFRWISQCQYIQFMAALSSSRWFIKSIVGQVQFE